LNLKSPRLHGSCYFLLARHPTIVQANVVAFVTPIYYRHICMVQVSLTLPVLTSFFLLPYVVWVLNHRYFLTMGAGAALCLLIINACEDHLGYSKPLNLSHRDVTINAACAVGDHPSSPPLSHGHPEKNIQTKHTTVLIPNVVVKRPLVPCVLN
jgi:hypothetical protein